MRSVCGGVGGTEAIRCVLLRTLEAVEGRLCLLEVLEVIRRVLCMLEAVEGEICLLEVLKVLELLGGDASCAALYSGGRRGRGG